jgi:tetratricopeptide (TPR) repeat protein
VRALIPRALAEAQRSRNQPERQGHLFSLLGSVYATIGDYERAIDVLESARTVQRSVYGAGHLNVVETERLLGENYRRVGRLEESRSTLERVLLVERGALPPDHARIAATLTELHFVYREEGDLETAEALLSEGLAVRERLAGDVPDAGVAESINLLAAIQRRRGRLEDARSNYQRALEIRRRLHPDGDTGPIAESLNNLGVQAVAEGDLLGADTLFGEAAEIFARAYGEGHEFVSIARRQRSMALRKLGRHEEVIEIRRALLLADSVRLGPFHDQLAESHLFIGASLRDLGRYAEAAEEYDLAEMHTRRRHGDDHPYLGVVLQSRARLHVLNGDPAQGLHYVDRAIDLYERHERSGYAIAAYRTRGELNVALGRDEAARDDLEESLRRARQEGSETQIEAATPLLIGVYDRLGDRVGAESLRAR